MKSYGKYRWTPGIHYFKDINIRAIVIPTPFWGHDIVLRVPITLWKMRMSDEESKEYMHKLIQGDNE